MTQDPRVKNKTFNKEHISLYLHDYAAQLSSSLQSISQENLEKARLLLIQVRNAKGRIFAAGNGGSGAISEHLGCDWHKGIHHKHLPGLKVHSLVSNSSLLTAVANDFGYDKSFSYQLEMAQLTPKDAVVLISSSGNSPNIIQAAEHAKSCGCPVLGLTGFSGGKLKQISDIAIHVPYDNYGLVEDAHQVVMHVLAQYHDFEFSNLKS